MVVSTGLIGFLPNDLVYLNDRRCDDKDNSHRLEDGTGIFALYPRCRSVLHLICYWPVSDGFGWLGIRCRQHSNQLTLR